VRGPGLTFLQVTTGLSTVRIGLRTEGKGLSQFRKPGQIYFLPGYLTAGRATMRASSLSDLTQIRDNRVQIISLKDIRA
jgi:hypothetical protein